MSSASSSDTRVSTIIHAGLGGVYRDPQRVIRDAEALLRSPTGSHLRPTTEPLIKNDGSSTPPVLLLSGTVPMVYRGMTYNIPMDVYLPPPYPLRPPVCFVRPVSGMAIKENHRHVALDGMVYMPYLHEWRPRSHDLAELAVIVSSLFGSDPPCYAKPTITASPSASHSPQQHHNSVSASGTVANATSQSPPSYQEASAAEPDQERFEREIAEANAAAEAARRADAEERRQENEAKWLQDEHTRSVSSTREEAANRIRGELSDHYATARLELKEDLRDQRALEEGTIEIERQLNYLEEAKQSLAERHAGTDKALDELRAWIDGVEGSAKANDGVSAAAASRRADEIALPVDIHSAQMLALSTESAAIEDCIFFLDRALLRGSIPLDMFLKEVRKLSKRQFLAKAHLLKISQSRVKSR